MDLFQSPKFASRAEELMKEHHVPGLSIALIHNDKTASKGFGFASIEAKKPCTPDTIFDIASASKSLTAASLALLVEDNDNHPDLQWDTSMSELLPDDFVMAEPSYTDQIIVEDILSHRIGLPSHDSSYLGVLAKTPDTPRSVTRNLRNLKIIAPIRTKYMYCNLMFTVATHLIETKSTLPFTDFLSQNFFTPLNMTSTSLQPSQAHARGFTHRMTDGHYYDESTSTCMPVQPLNTPEDQGAGSIMTSANDYIKYVSALMHQRPPFTPSIYKALTTIRSLPEPDPSDCLPFSSTCFYALGWEISWYRGHQIVAHDGSIVGFTSTHFFLPEWKFGGVMLANSQGGYRVISALMRELVDEVVGTPEGERVADWNALFQKREDDAEARGEGDDSVEEVRAKLCEGLKLEEGDEVQNVPLEMYTGVFFDKGYHDMVVEIKDGGLFIDGTDRSMGFTLTLEHVRGQTHYVAHLSDAQEGGDIPFRAEFEFKDGRAVRLGLHLEPDMEEYIWFDRVE